MLVWCLDVQGASGNHAGYVTYHFGLNGDRPVVGDWAGGGKTCIGTVRPAGAVLEWSLDGTGDGVWDPSAGDLRHLFGRAGDVPVVGAWAAGGRTEIGTYRADLNGVDLVFSLDGGGTGVFQAPPDAVNVFGRAGDTGLVGDWSGDGRAKIGTYRPGTDALDLIFSLDKDGDGTYDPAGGDIGSLTGFAGGGGGQVVTGAWKS